MVVKALLSWITGRVRVIKIFRGRSDGATGDEVIPGSAPLGAFVGKIIEGNFSPVVTFDRIFVSGT